VRERFDVRSVDGHHRVNEKGQVDPLGLTGELEGSGISVENPRPLNNRFRNRRGVLSVEQAFLDSAVRELVKNLDNTVSNRQDSRDRADAISFETKE
jgi:hypothetical protein